MSNRLEKYIDYVVSDLVGRTAIEDYVDYVNDDIMGDDVSVYFPFLDYSAEYGVGTSPDMTTLWPTEIESFEEYLGTQYGCSPTEYNRIMRQYLNELWVKLKNR